MKIKTSTIDELCNVEYGTRVTRKRDGGDIYPVYGGGGKTFLIDKMNRKNRVVIARFAMSEKCTRFIEGDFFLNDSGLTLSPKNNTISQIFLDKIILAFNNIIYAMGRGMAQRNLDMKQFRLLKITYPESLLEQKKIIDKIDVLFGKIDKAIVHIEANHENIKKIEISYLRKFLDGNFANKKIGDICQLVYGKGLAQVKRGTEKNGIPVYGANGIKSYTSNPLYKKKSIIIGRKGSAGELQWVEKPFWALDVTYYTINNDKEVELRYLYYLLKMLNLPKLAKGIKPGINRNDVYNLSIKLPQINEQLKTVDSLEKILKQKSILSKLYKKQLINYVALKSAIFNKVLSNKSA